MRRHVQQAEVRSLTEILNESFVGERIANDSYRAMICFQGDCKDETRRLLEAILAVAEASAADLLSVPENPAKQSQK